MPRTWRCYLWCLVVLVLVDVSGTRKPYSYQYVRRDFSDSQPPVYYRFDQGEPGIDDDGEVVRDEYRDESEGGM